MKTGIAVTKINARSKMMPAALIPQCESFLNLRNLSLKCGKERLMFHCLEHFLFNLTQYWRPFRPLRFRYRHTGLKPCALCCRAFSPKHVTD
jgi:hypothetical protein